MSKRMAVLLMAGGVAIAAFGVVTTMMEPAPLPETPVARKPLPPSEDVAGIGRLAAIREAERATDALQRCRTAPVPAGWNWSAGMIDAFCADYHTPRMAANAFFSWLNDEEFSKADSHFEEVADAFHAGRMPEGAYWFNYSRTFWYAGPELTPPLVAWATAMPRSPHAQLALAMHHTANAFGWRTEKPLREVPETDLAKMKDEATLARAAAEKAITLDPRTLPAYAVLIHLSMIGISDEVAAKARDDAFRVRPDTFYVREAMMRPAWPMWGGSTEAMQAIADEAAPHLGNNPRLASLQAMARGYVAMERWWEDDHRQAARLYEQALSHGIDWTFIDQADDAFTRVGDPVRAVEAMTQQLRFTPGNMRVRIRRAKQLVKLEQDEWALQEFAAMAAAGGENNQQFMSDYVWALIQLGRDDEAVARLQTLRAGAPGNRWATLALARQYLYRTRDFPAALPLIDELLAQDDEDGAAWLLRTDYLQNTEADEASITEAARNFVRFIDESEIEQRSALPKVQGWLQRGG